MGAPLLSGLLLGLLVAAQVGPIWLLCARSSLRYGARVGLAIGLGAALVDLSYAVLGALGVARLVTVDWLRPVLGITGALVLVVIGVRTLWSALRVRAGAEDDSEVASPRAAFRTAVVATASNPLTIASWAAIFGAAAVGDLASSPAHAVALLLGIGIGSLSWFVALSTVLGLLGRRLGDRSLQVVDVVSGVGIIGFGGLLGWRALHRS